MKNSAEANRRNQAIHREKMRELGYEQTQVWVPGTHVDEIRWIAEQMQADPTALFRKIRGNEPTTEELANKPIETPVMKQFWNVYHQLESAGKEVNHSHQTNEIAINISQFYKVASCENLELPDRRRVVRGMRDSQRHKFLKANWVVSSFILRKPTRCYIFGSSEQQ